ncbi:MAG: hypothetical protein J6R18_00935 [Kiritimatiellae bacterium]|nr:hypothetical protein [Kiritimatiellia bacterium]
MKKIFFFILPMALVQAAFALDKARIDQIAQWLPERPAAPGARIGDRAAWNRIAALPTTSNWIESAEKIINSPIPELPDELYLEFSTNGNRTRFQKPYFARVQVLNILLFAECVENKGRFIPGIIERVKVIAAERSWVNPAHDLTLSAYNGIPHIDLGSARRTVTFSYVYDWLRDVLPQDVKKLIYEECDRRSFKPYLETCENSKGNSLHWWYEEGNNWNSVCNSSIVRSALAMIEDRGVRAIFVASAEHTVPFALSGYTPDGYCSEGMGYWNFGYGHHLSLGLAVRAATGGKVDLFADPKNRNIMLYPYGYQISEWKSPQFADGGGNPHNYTLALQRQIYPDIVCKKIAESDLLDTIKFDMTYISLRAFGQDPGPKYEGGLDCLPPRSFFPDAQVLISRFSRPKPDGNGGLKFGIAIKGGHNAELHNHNDVGSYVILLDGTEMSGDPGGEIYTKRTFSKDRYVSKVLNSYGHPVPVVGGKLQETGRKAAGKVLRTEFTDAKDIIEIDYTSAYDVPALKSLVRTMVFDRSAISVTIADKVEFSEPTSFEVPVITYRKWEANGKTDRFSFRKSDNAYRIMKMEVKASESVKFADEKIENPGKPDVTRLKFAFENPVTNATFTTIFSTR